MAETAGRTRALPSRGRRAPATLLLATVLPLLAATVAHAAPAQARGRAAALVAQMTLDEKISMVHGTEDPDDLGQAGYLPGVPRLGIPPLRLADGPAGIRVDAPTTALPAPVALGATFDPDAARAFGGVQGHEGRARGQDVLLAPMMNTVRVPNAGRNFETYGEDPFHMRQLVAAAVEGVQDEGLIATAKHYAHNNQETDRQTINVNVDERTAHEIELPGFEAAAAAGAGAVMCAYNQVNGAPACSNATLLTQILREQWGFDGWVMSDWGATHSTESITAGLDMEMPGYPLGPDGQVWFSERLKAAVAAGAIPEAALDQAVIRILSQMERFGLLDGVPPRPELDVEAGAEVARQVAEDGAVLLTNHDGALPLGEHALGSLAVVGPTARQLLVGGGGSARVQGFDEREQSPLDALTERGAQVDYQVGAELEGVAVPAAALTPAGDPDAEGLLRTPAGGGTPQVDPTVEFTGDAALPAGGSWTWTGTLTAPTTGDYALNLQASGGDTTLTVDGQEIASNAGFFGVNPSLIPTTDGLERAGTTLRLEAGVAHEVTVTATAAADTPLQLRFAWVTPEHRQSAIAAAAAAAGDAHTAVVFAYNEGTEGADRPSLSLPGIQDQLIEAVAAANPRTVVVLNTGDPVLMPWVDQVAAVLEMWYPGQEGGDATAAVLTGEVNPGGKLPVTFPASEDDPPTANNPERFPGVGGQQTYAEGILVGYRWYDAKGIEPLFPFGHGLSYTDFDYSDLQVAAAGDGLEVTFQVRNTGKVSGAAVPQVYLGPPADAPVAMEPRQLVGFERVELEPGETAAVTVPVGVRGLSYWSAEQDRWVVAAGERAVTVGASSRDVRLEGTVDVPAA